ncbi:MAG TPA: DUF805 domain-containing protein [Herpetosiphonaceae bacterium]
MSLQELYLSPNGRINRRTFWLYGVLVFVAISLVASLLDGLLDTNGIIGGIAGVLLIVPGIMVQIKRWHDRDKSGWWILIGLVPIIGGIWALVETGFLPGTPGPNRFGAPQTADPVMQRA